MNTQRKVVITTTYNEMGIIIDTKAEEVTQPYTTTHDSIPAKTGKNDGDGTSGDCISRQQAINEIHEDAEWLAAQGSDWQTERMERDKSILMSLPSVQPEIIRCNSCKYWTQSTGKMKGYGLGRCDFHDADLVTCNGFCYWAERRTDD